MTGFFIILAYIGAVAFATWKAWQHILLRKLEMRAKEAAEKHISIQREIRDEMAASLRFYAPAK